MADASVDSPPHNNVLFDFEKKFLGCHDSDDYIKLSTWVKSKIGDVSHSDLLLQMDIEGAEFDVIIDTSSDILRKFRIMVIEFHSMEMIFDRYALKFLNAVFSKLTENFVIAHIHPNNCMKPISIGEIIIPRVLEVSFLRKDRLKEIHAVPDLTFPHELDRKNIEENDDIALPSIWWKP